MCVQQLVERGGTRARGPDVCVCVCVVKVSVQSVIDAYGQEIVLHFKHSLISTFFYAKDFEIFYAVILCSEFSFRNVNMFAIFK